jgi:hypothetical protein
LSFARTERKLDKVLVAGHYTVANSNGTQLQLKSPDWFAYTSAISSCPKG